MPGAAEKAFTVATDPSAEALDFVEVIESDEGLSARILKIANSVYFSRGEESETIVEAVTTIGTAELRTVLGSSTLQELFPSGSPLRTSLWEHDVSVAIISRFLAEQIQPDVKEEAFLAGLMHDVGKLFMLQRAPAEYEKAMKEARSSGDFKSAEGDVFPFDHTEVGHLLAEHWHFSEPLTRSIRGHHNSWEELEPKGMTAIVKTADLLAHRFRFGLPPDYSRVFNAAAVKLPQAWEFLKLSRDSSEVAREAEQRVREEKDIYLV